MDSNEYKILDEARARVLKAIGAIKLPKDENGSYTHDDATLFFAENRAQTRATAQ